MHPYHGEEVDEWGGGGYKKKEYPNFLPLSPMWGKVGGGYKHQELFHPTPPLLLIKVQEEEECPLPLC